MKRAVFSLMVTLYNNPQENVNFIIQPCPSWGVLKGGFRVQEGFRCQERRESAGSATTPAMQAQHARRAGCGPGFAICYELYSAGTRLR